MTHIQTCPRCGHDFAGEESAAVATEVVEHARAHHGHSVSHAQIVAHLEEQAPDRTDG